MVKIIKQDMLEVHMAIQRWIDRNVVNEQTWEQIREHFKMDFEVLPDDDLMFLFWKIFKERVEKGRIEALPNGVFVLRSYGGVGKNVVD